MGSRTKTGISYLITSWNVWKFSLFQKLADLLGLDQGCLTLSHGNHELFVPTNYKPKFVWLYLETDDCIPVCHGDVDLIGTNCLNNGFVLYAKIKSNSVKVNWIAFYDIMCEE